jgi:predicted Na+-dependent transporter
MSSLPGGLSCYYEYETMYNISWFYFIRNIKLSALQNVEDGICKSVAYIFLIAIILGLGYQPAARSINPYIAYFLMTVMFLGFLKVDAEQLKHEFRNIGYHLWLLLLSMIIIPIIFYYLVYAFSLFTPGISKAFSVGALLFFGTSTAAVAGPLTLLFKGRFERTMLNTALSSIAVIGTLPLLFVMLDEGAVDFSYLQLFIFMVELIIAPLVAAVIVRIVAPPVHKALSPHVPALSVLLLALVILGCVMGLDKFFVGQYAYVIGAIISAAVCLILCFAIAWFFAFKKDRADRLTSAIVCTWINIGLTVVIADKFFRHNSPLVILFVSLATIPWNLMVFPLKWFFHPKT